MKKLSINDSLVTISIVSHGNAEEILQLLDSLNQHESTDQFQVIITDNLGNEFPELDGIEWASFCIIRNETPLGFARNHNQAFKIAKGKYFCILNPDVVFEQAVFPQLLQRIEASQIDIIAPLVVDSKGIVQDSFRDLPTPFDIIRRRLPANKIDYTVSKPKTVMHPDWLSGIFLLMRRNTFRDLGGFDERYWLYFEDVEFCTRSRLQGMRLAVDMDVRIQHDAQRASRKNLKHLSWHLQSAFRFFTSSIYKKIKQTSK